MRPWLDCSLDGTTGLETAISIGLVDVLGAGAFRLMTLGAETTKLIGFNLLHGLIL